MSFKQTGGETEIHEAEDCRVILRLTRIWMEYDI